MSGVVYMTEVRRPREVQKRIEECVRENRCIVPGCTCEMDSRGRCTSHYQQLIHLESGMTEQEVVDFEADLYKEGLDLKLGEIRDLRRLVKQNDRTFELAKRRSGS